MTLDRRILRKRANVVLRISAKEFEQVASSSRTSKCTSERRPCSISSRCCIWKIPTQKLRCFIQRIILKRQRHFVLGMLAEEFQELLHEPTHRNMRNLLSS